MGVDFLDRRVLAKRAVDGRKPASGHESQLCQGVASGHPQGRSAAKEPRSGLTRRNPLTLDPTCCGFSHSLFAIYVRFYAAVNTASFLAMDRPPSALGCVDMVPSHNAFTLAPIQVPLDCRIVDPSVDDGSVPRRFARIKPQHGCRVWGGRASRNGGCVGPAGPPRVRPCASTPSASRRRWPPGTLRVPGGGVP